MNASSTGTGLIQDKSINVSMAEIGSWRKSINSSVEILNYPGRKWQILRKFHFILPKFYFILPKFYFTAPWRIFICSLEISDFLGRRVTAGGGGRSTERPYNRYSFRFDTTDAQQ